MSNLCFDNDWFIDFCFNLFYAFSPYYYIVIGEKEEGEMTIISVTYMYVVSLWQKGLCSLEDESMASSSTLQ